MVLKLKNQSTPTPLILAVLCLFLSACSSVFVPQVGAIAPCQIQSITQVEAAVRAGLEKQGWKIISVSDHAIQAQKTFKQMSAKIDLAYGYRGFSIEYVDSQNMDYDVEDDTIDPTYKKWAYNLMNAIQARLEQQVKLNPSVKCLGKDQGYRIKK